MLITELYKERLKELAGIVSEAISQSDKETAFSMSHHRMPYNKDLMIQAIKEGREIGILFKSDNDRYSMPVAKYRIIYPICLGLSKKGNAVIRAWHKLGQSESKAIETGVRSAEVEDEWRLFKVSNIKSMWFTNKFFSAPPEKYNSNDKGMTHVEVAADFNKIKKFQKDLIDSHETDKDKKQQQKNIINLFKKPEEENKEEDNTINKFTKPNVKPSTKPLSTIKPKKTNDTGKNEDGELEIK